MSVSNKFKEVHAFQLASNLQPPDNTNPCESAYAYSFILIGSIASAESYIEKPFKV
jgi:hypothetical protein